MATRPPADAASIMQSYLDFGTARTNGKLDEKMAEVSRASAQKREDLDPYVTGAGIVTGKGVQSASPYEMDYRNLNPAQLMSRYGADEGLSMATSRRRGIEAYLQPNYAPDRTTGQVIGDTLNTVVAAPVQMLGGIGALEAGGLGQIARWTGNEDLARGYETEAQWISDRTGRFTRAMQGGQSQQMQDSRRAFGAETSLDERDNAKLYADEVKSDGSFLAGAKRIARDTIDSFGNAFRNPTMAGDTIANAGGSLIGGGILSKTLKTIGKGIVKTGAVSGTGRVAALGSKAAMPASIVGMESGAAYQQTFDAAMQDLAQRTDLTEDQKREMANKAGLEAAAIQGGVTAVTAPLLGGSHFERAPFSVNSVTGAFRRAAGETIEEGFQEGSAQLAQNRAIQDQVDPNQVLSEGVGQGVALGAIGGLGSSAATQAPGVAVRTALETAKLPVRALSKALTFAGDRVSRGNEAYRDQLVAQADAEEAAAQEAANAPRDYSERPADPLEGITADDPDVVETAHMFGIPQSRIENALREGDFRAQVSMTKQMKTVADNKAPIEDRLDAMADMNGLRDDQALAENIDNVDGLKGIKNVVKRAAEHPIIQNALAGARKIANENAPKINAHLMSMLDNVQQIKAKKNPTPEELDANTATLDATAAYALSMAEQSPDKADPTVNDRIQFHADQGDITLSSQQRSTLRASTALVRGAQQGIQENKYQLPDADEVSRQILTKKWEREKEVVGDLRKKSLLEHMEGVRSAYNAGDLQLASDRLADLRFFAEHMSNKVGALNASFRAPGEDGRHVPVKYDALIRPRVFRQTQGDGLLVVPYRENSVRFAQQVAVEASTVASVLNNLIDAFPDAAQLGGLEHLGVPSLDPLLDGDAVTVAEDYRLNRRLVPGNSGNATNGASDPTMAEADQAVQVEPSSQEAVSEDTQDADVTPDQPVREATETNVASEEKVQESVREADENQPTATEESVPEPGSLSNLLGSKQENRAKAAFSEPKNKTSRTMDVVDPIATVRAFMRNENALKASVGGELNRAFPASVAKAYQQLLEIGQNLAEIMDERLAAYLKDRGNRNVSPEQAMSFIEGQALNIMDAETGKYDPTMLQNAVLAGLQWYLKINQYGSRMDEKDARQYLRMDQNAILPEGFIDELNVGMTQAQTVRSLAREIGRFWGLTENQNTPRNYAEGVKEGVAKELLEAMMNLKLDGVSMIDQIKIDISGVTTNENINELNHYAPGTLEVSKGEFKSFLEPDDAVREFPTAIEKAVLTEPEEINYIGTPPSEVQKTQLRNDAVENTERQNASTKIQQEVSHFLNEPFIEMLDLMGEPMVLRLFAGGDIESKDRALNVNHKKTLKGRNVTVQSAFRTILGLRAETANAASRNGTAVSETPIFYAYNNTVVNRSQMLGKDNPQSNKLMREAVLPTWATLDLTNGATRDAYMMGLAQALGIKVHTQDPATSIEQVTQKLGQFTKTLEILNGTSPTRFTAEAIDTMKAEGVDSVVALHALMDWARLQNTEDKSNFRTAVYFEADGVTNGVINAMALFSSDKFTGEQLEALQRGGYNVGEEPLSLGQIRKAFDAKAADLYGLAGTKTTQAIRALRAEYQGSSEVTRQFNAVRDLLVEFIGDISYDGQNLIVDRGAAKNPLTITIYGSGERGIAGNIVDEIVAKIYERMSDAAQRRLDDKSLTPAQAFYGGDAETAQAKFDRLMNAVNSLTKEHLVKDDIKGLFVQDARTPKKESAKDFVNFTFAAENIRSLRENVLHAFVGPMVEGIEQTVGEDLMQSMNLIKTQVQAWSLIGKFAYQQAYDRVMANKLRDNPKRSKNELLSRAEEERVLQSVWSFLPYFSTGDQNFLFGMKQAMDVRSEFAQSLTQTLETPAFGYTPDDAGVAGVPGLTIGSGDGQTVMNAVLDPRIKDLTAGFMQIFDGIHSSVADMNLMSQISNQAVFDAWRKNPLENLSDAFASMVGKLDLSKLNLTDEQRALLTKSLFPARFWNTKMTDELLTVRLNQWAKHGQEIAQKVSERHAVMEQVQSSVDQMAGASSPYLNEGLILSGSSSQKAAAMENLRKSLNTEQQEQQREKTLPPAKFSSPELMGKMLEKQIAKITKDPTTRALLREVVRSGRVDDYAIHMGTREELLTVAADMGIAIPADRARTFMGFHVGDAKAVFVVDGNPETMLHELIHAATFETIDAHYRGEDVGTAAQLAISNLEELMAEFKATDLKNDAQQNALDEMERQEAAGSRAGELNEFMAWSLANADLQASLKAQEAPVAVRMARKVVQAIKALLWGGKRSAAVKDDMFSNIRFNTNILMRVPTLSESNARTVLFHDPSFGESPRITALMERIKNKLTDYADTNEVERLLRKSEVTTQQVRAASVANNFEAAGFNMNPQERMAFLHMVAVMGTAVDIDPNSAVRAQELFTHVGKHLGIEEFLRNPTEDDPADTAQATAKFNVLMGKLVGKKDSHDRSFVLPAFMALAATNDEFRSILNKMPMPKTQYAQWNSVDNILDNIGDTTIDNLSRWVSGEGIMSKDVQTAVDGLMGQMLQTNEEARLFIEKFTNPIGNGVDRANDTVRDAMDWVGKTTRRIANESKAKNPNAKVRNLMLDSVATVGALLNEENGHEAATQFMSAANQRKVWTPLYDMLKDLIGRTAENAQVYDLIKIARTWVNGMRQQFREQLPRILNGKFSRVLTEDEQTHLHQGLGQTGLASLIRGNSVDQALNLLADEDARNAEIQRLEDRISSRANGPVVLTKAKQLADFMIHKKSDRRNLLRNAEAIAHLLGEGVKGADTSSEQIRDIDHLTSLYAVQNLSAATRASLSSLVQSEAKGMSFMLSYLQGQDEIDAAKAKGNARFNHFKGYMPADSQQGVSLIVASDQNADKLLEKSYIRLGKYDGSSKDPTTKYMAYYYAPVSGRAPFAQGIMQNVQQTVSGVDLSTGFSTNLTAGQITDPQLVQRLAARNQESGNTLLPVYDENGNLFAFERSIDPSVLPKLQQNTNMSKMMGVRSGRQSEEATAHQINKALIDRLRDMWDADRKSRSGEYVDLFKSTDPIHKDAVKIFSNETRAYIQARFPEGFMVRKDMIDDAIGYRQASIGDVWTGNSRWSPTTQEHVKQILKGMWGNKAFARAVKAEQLLQNVIQDVRVAIVIKSIVVPMANAASNIYQLIGRGVPIVNILREIPKKTAEIESWHKSRIRQIEAEAELHATDDPIQQRRLEAEIQTIKDSHKRLSIWPLLEAGEFSSISDAGSRDDILLTEGKLSEYLERAVNKLPPAVRTAGKYAIISKDTALFRALQKSVEYGDFVAKAIIYDDLTKRQKQSREYALGRVTEEFVNYDRLPGRDRAYLESIGLMWFWNFKIRSAKVALSMVRNNPIHSLIATSLPLPISGVGLPLDDNLWSALFDGRLTGSVGYHMAFRAPGLLPIGNLLG